jgi:hypothetical protein
MAFRLTDDAVEIVRQIARFRFIRWTHKLVGRSVDRTNDRIMHLYYAGHMDRPRDQRLFSLSMTPYLSLMFLCTVT